MPYTISHIAFALPIKKVFKNISCTGLVIGSILPDIEYYLRLEMYGTWGNTLKGIFFYELPLGILLSFLFHTLMRDQLIRNLPNPLYQNWKNHLNFDWPSFFRINYLAVTFSLLLGISTHLFWDIFTHESNYIFNISIDFLNNEIFGRPVYAWNQIIFSIIGLMALLFIIFQSGEQSNMNPQRSSKDIITFWLKAAGLTLIIFFVKNYFGVPNEKFWIHQMVIITGAFFISLLLVCASKKLHSKYFD